MIDEIRRVPVVSLARNVLADVVQQRRVLEHLAVVVVELVQRARLVEQAQRETRDVLRVLEVGAAPARETGDRGPPQRRAGRPTSRRDRGMRTASSTMPSRSAQSLVTISVDVEQRRRSSRAASTPAGSSSARLLLDAREPAPLRRRASARSGAAARGAVRASMRRPFALAGIVAVLAGGGQAGEIVDRAARARPPSAARGREPRRRSGPGRRGCGPRARSRSALDGGSRLHELGGEAADAERHARRPAQARRRRRS